MRRNATLCLLVFCFVAAVAGPVRAQYKTTYIERPVSLSKYSPFAMGYRDTTEIWLSQYAMTTSFGEAGMLLRLDRNSLYIIRHDDSTFYELPVDPVARLDSLFAETIESHGDDVTKLWREEGFTPRGYYDYLQTVLDIDPDMNIRYRDLLTQLDLWSTWENRQISMEAYSSGQIRVFGDRPARHQSVHMSIGDVRIRTINAWLDVQTDTRFGDFLTMALGLRAFGPNIAWILDTLQTNHGLPLYVEHTYHLWNGGEEIWVDSLVEVESTEAPDGTFEVPSIYFRESVFDLQYFQSHLERRYVRGTIPLWGPAKED